MSVMAQNSYNQVLEATITCEIGLQTPVERNLIKIIYTSKIMTMLTIFFTYLKNDGELKLLILKLLSSF